MKKDADHEDDPHAVNLHRLPEEWADQPRKYRGAARRCVARRRDWERAKSRLKVVTSKLRKRVRLDPARYDLGSRPAKDDVEAAVTCLKEYQEADGEVIDSHYAYGIAEADKDAFDHRKYALQDEVKMLLSDLFAMPRVKRAIEQDLQIKRDRRALNRGK